MEPGHGFIRVGTLAGISWGTFRMEAMKWKIYREHDKSKWLLVVRREEKKYTPSGKPL